MFIEVLNTSPKLENPILYYIKGNYRFIFTLDTKPTWLEKCLAFKYWEHIISKLHKVLQITKEDKKLYSLFYDINIPTIKSR